MIRLEPISEDDLRVFEGTSYDEMSDGEKLCMIRESLRREHEGRFFQLLAVRKEDITVGFMSLYGPSEHIIRISPEIKKAYRGNNFGYLGETLALGYAKEAGYTVALASVREDNPAGIALHEKLGFEAGTSCLSKKGQPIRIYIRRL